MERWTRREVLAASALGAAGLAGRRGMASSLLDDKTQEKPKPQPAAPASRSCWGSLASAAWAAGCSIFSRASRTSGSPRSATCTSPTCGGPVGGRRQAGGLPRLPQAPRSQGHRRRRDRHARPLARDPDHPGLPGRQGRLLREAADAPDRRGPRRGDRGRESRARHPDGQPDPRRRELPPGRRDRPLRRRWARSARRASGWPPTAADWASRPTASPRPAATTTSGSAPPPAALQPQSLHVQLALVLGLRRAAPDRLLLPHRRPRPLGHGRRRPADDHRHRRPVRAR